jgi:Plasmid encoded RepA protein
LPATVAGMSEREEQDLFGPGRLPKCMPKVKPLSRIKERLIDSAVQIEAEDPNSITYQHTVLCQTGLPYRDPGAQVREWERRQGNVALKVSAGEAMHPKTGKWVKLTIPFGPKPRLILTHLNREALIHGSPEIEVEDSLTAFMKRILRFDPNGKEIRKFKDQLTRLAASMIRLAIIQGDRAFQIDTKVVTAFDLWFPKDQRQRVLWPSTVHLSLDYFESLQRHAVPLDERAVASLSHSAMGLDIYAWLAQRLHRIEIGKPAFVPWMSLKEQFGHQYGRMDNFKRVFRETLNMVLTQYRAARIELDGRGMTLRNSSPPIKGRIALIRRA